MKKIIFMLATVLLMLSSCNRKVEYELISYATFDATSYSFDEDVQEVRVPVSIVNSSGAEVSLSVATIDGKAEEGVDYEVIYPVSGVLTFAPGETQQDIVLAITDFPDKLTGSKDFSLALSSVTEGFQVGGCNTVKLRIKDLDHPLKMFIGEWSASKTGYNGIKYSWTMTVEGDESDPTYSNLFVYDLDPFTSSYLGYSSEKGYNKVDAKVNPSKTQLIVAYDSYLATDVDGLIEPGCVFSIAGLDAPTLAQARSYDDVKMNLSKDGTTLTIVNAIGCLGNGVLFEIIDGPLVFTKK